MTVFAVGLDGDGKEEVVVGAENWHFQAFDSQGTLLWRFESIHRLTCGTAFDLEGDGKPEVIAGTEYYW